MVERLDCGTDDIRLDRFVSDSIDGYTRSFFGGLIDDGKVTVNGAVITKSGYKLKAGDIVEVDVPEPVETDMKPQDIPLDIVYEDDDLIIINKAQGMVVHPGAGHRDGTLCNALLYHCDGKLSDINGVIRPGIVHRIDKDTSGLMVAVKNNETHMKMAEMMASHSIKRQYRALVYGIVKHDKGVVDAPIGRGGGDRRKMVVTEDGKPSVTHFEVVKRYSEATDLKLILETGRTHQIRSHMTYIGHPVLGDPLYAPKRKDYGLKGQCLHSASIEFVHPRTGELLSFQADIPGYYKEVLSKLYPI
ncbi:MAG: RluA family pseudouridine synthase [Clostridiales bacterium]|nr:RluA family pseudouridine synthase [Clostridiales bacterium]